MTARFRLPFLNADNRAFWTGGADGRLMIHRCRACSHYTHPPMPICEACASRVIGPSAVSGKAVLHSFTINHQPWFPGNAVPFAFAVVELVEQHKLFVFTNIVDAPMDDIAIGMPLSVRFEQHEDVWLPCFAPDRGA
jgi:uncharacterized OB-fold protein